LKTKQTFGEEFPFLSLSNIANVKTDVGAKSAVHWLKVVLDSKMKKINEKGSQLRIQDVKDGGIKNFVIPNELYLPGEYSNSPDAFYYTENYDFLGIQMKQGETALSESDLYDEIVKSIIFKIPKKTFTFVIVGRSGIHKLTINHTKIKFKGIIIAVQLEEGSEIKGMTASHKVGKDESIILLTEEGIDLLLTKAVADILRSNKPSYDVNYFREEAAKRQKTDESS